jgi:chromate transporter
MPDFLFMSETPPDVRPPSRRELFFGFLGLGLTAFGGALPLARRALVDRRRWLSGEEFTELLGLCQFLPGGNVINLSVAMGMRFHGVSGAICAILGLVAGPTAIVIGLGVLYERFHDDPALQHLFTGLAAAAAGLMVSMAVKMAKPLRRKPLAALIALAAFVALGVVQVPLLWTMLVLTPLSILVLARWSR